MKLILIFASQILLVVLCGNAAATEAENCQLAYQNWLHKYGGSDPYQAISKATPWKVDMRFLGKDMANSSVKPSDLPHYTLHLDGKTYDSGALLTGSLNDIDDLTKRDLSVRSNLVAFVGSPSQANTLRIAYVGQFHAMDLYLSHPELTPAYVEKPYTESTPLYSPKFLELNKVLKMENAASTVRDISADDFLATYNSTLQSMKQLSLAKVPDRTLEPNTFDQSTVVIGEVHEPNSAEWLNGLPTPQCLKAMGYSTVQVGFEGYPKGLPIDGPFIIKDRTLQAQFEYRATKTSKAVADFLQSWPADLKAAYYAGKIIDNTSGYKFVKVLETYQKAGITVHFDGLEATDYDWLDDDSN